MHRGCIYLFHWGVRDSVFCPCLAQCSCLSAHPGCHHPWQDIGNPLPARRQTSVRQCTTSASRAGVSLAKSIQRICGDVNCGRDFALQQRLLTPSISFPSFKSEVATGKQLSLCEVSYPYWAGWNQLLVKLSLRERFSFVLGSWMTEKHITRTPHWK